MSASSNPALSARRTSDPDSWRQRVEAALRAAGGNVTEAARKLGVTRRTIYRWLPEVDYDGPRTADNMVQATRAALRQSRGDVNGAASILKIAPNSLWQRLRRWEIRNYEQRMAFANGETQKKKRKRWPRN